MAATSIHIHNAALAYHGRAIFSQLQVDLPAGKCVALLGASGVGKSSFLRMIAQLTTAEEIISGQIHAGNFQPLHAQIAYMAQTDLLLPWLTVLQNACLGAKLRSQTRCEYKKTIEQAKQLLQQVGLADKCHAYPAQLSGGMRQRVALVRTLIENKSIVLMDEPFSALDAITRYKLQDLAAEMLKDKTVLFVTHDPNEALRLAHIIYVMQGQPAQLKKITELNSLTPRELSDPTLHALQHELYQALLAAAKEVA